VLVAAANAACEPTARGSSVPTVTTKPSFTATVQGTSERVRYAALGDSYTIGTSVSEQDRWPNQLARALPALELVANLGVNGFTSRDVIEAELPQLPALRPEIVSLLIGVNDVVQGAPRATYRANVVQILDELVEAVGAEDILVVTTPDYTVTPGGAAFGDPATQSAAIRDYNAIIAGLATARGIAVVDIYGISLEAAGDRALVASDGLHPSGAQYARWVTLIAPVTEAILPS
jgi:lysophospholipase L1-like esterase